MKCRNWKCNNDLTGRQQHFCSDKCRMKHARSKSNTKPEQAKPEQQSRTLTDACGNVHKIDFAGRRKDYVTLDSWVNGEGTREQKMLGLTALQYSVINGFKDTAGKLTEQGRRYLGEVA